MTKAKQTNPTRYSQAFNVALEGHTHPNLKKNYMQLDDAVKQRRIRI